MNDRARRKARGVVTGLWQLSCCAPKNALQSACGRRGAGSATSADCSQRPLITQKKQLRLLQVQQQKDRAGYCRTLLIPICVAQGS